MERIIRITELQLVSVFRRPVWWILLAFGTFFSIGCFIYVYDKDPFISINQMSYGQAVITIVVMMIGVEIRREQRKAFLDDIFTAYLRHIVINPAVHVISVIIISLAVTIVIGTGCVVVMALDNAPWIWISQNLLMIMLLYLLPCIITGLWGLLISEIIKGKSVFLPAVLVWFFSSSMCSYITEMISFANTSGGKTIFNFLNLGLNSFHMFRNINTGAEVELPRWIVRVCTLVILAFLYIIFCSNARQTEIRCKKAGYAVPVIVSVGILSLLYVNYGVFFSRFSDPVDAMNYVLDKSEQLVFGEGKNAGDITDVINITIRKTDINLRCDSSGIHAVVIMSAVQIKDGLDQNFTLYSDLEIDNVTVNGEKAKFNKLNEGFEVIYPNKISAGENIEFQFVYHGYSLPTFPANETTVQLNRAFPWVPWPGLRTVSIYENEIYNETEWFFISDSQRGGSVEYSLKYEGPGNIYCNLKEQPDGSWTGISDSGVSIYSGMIHNSYDGIDVYIPASQYRKGDLPAKAVGGVFSLVESLSEKLSTEKKPLYPESIVLIQMRVPVVNSCPQELYYWGNEWEIRARNESSAILTITDREGNIWSYELIKAAVTTLISPATGFPMDVSKASAEHFAALYSYYIYVENNDNDIEKTRQERDILLNMLSAGSYEPYGEMLIEETPLEDKELDQLSDILDAMERKDNFDEAFREIYRILIRGKYVTLREMLELLTE